MLSKELLSRSLLAVYKEMLYNDSSQANNKLKEEIWEISQDKTIYSDAEIEQNASELQKIETISKYKIFMCEIDGAVKVQYENAIEKTGKQIQAASSFVIKSGEELIMENFFPIAPLYGETDTNSHIAEFQALVSCLRVLSIYHPNPEMIDVIIHSDSEVLTKQINLESRVRDAARQNLRDEALEYSKHFKTVKVIYFPREENGRADLLAKMSRDHKSWTY